MKRERGKEREAKEERRLEGENKEIEQEGERAYVWRQKQP